MEMVEEKKVIVFVRDEISELVLLVATDKGAFLYYSDGDRRHWDVNGPHFLGSVIHHLVLDPRDKKTHGTRKCDCLFARPFGYPHSASNRVASAEVL